MLYEILEIILKQALSWTLAKAEASSGKGSR
jgi:hypothetical protein